jgi:glycosyltransferase involved in cell wall biosynthesis
LIIQGLLLRLLGKKIILDVEEDVRADIKEKNWLPSKAIFKFFYLLFEKLAVRYFYLIQAEESYADIYKTRTTNFIIVQNFVPLSELEPSYYSPTPGENTLALIGALGARRALPFILDAIYVLQQKGIVVKLKCIGARDEAVEDILNRSTSWPFVKKQIDFKGYMPFPVCLDECRGCFAGLALPETLPNHIHSYPTKMFEYMAIGLPVISSDFELYKEVIDKYECGIAVHPEDPLAIANAIEFLMTHPDEAKRFSKNAIDAVHNFDWKTEEVKLLDFYQKIINN